MIGLLSWRRNRTSAGLFGGKLPSVAILPQKGKAAGGDRCQRVVTELSTARKIIRRGSSELGASGMVVVRIGWRDVVQAVLILVRSCEIGVCWDVNLA
jgi:hypothetical protein